MPCCVFTGFSAFVIRPDNLDARSSLSEDVDVWPCEEQIRTHAADESD